jgi:hypothetical protein
VGGLIEELGNGEEGAKSPLRAASTCFVAIALFTLTLLTLPFRSRTSTVLSRISSRSSGKLFELFGRPVLLETWLGKRVSTGGLQ